MDMVSSKSVVDNQQHWVFTRKHFAVITVDLQVKGGSSIETNYM